MARPTANIGDRLLVPAGHAPVRIATVVDVVGPRGGPPLLVEWENGDHSLLFPSISARVLPAAHLDESC